MRHTTVRPLLAVALASMTFAGAANAQGIPDIRGFHLGAAVNATSIKLDETAFSDDQRENGYGANIYAGYNFTKNLGLLLSLTAANINDSDTEDFSVAHIDLAGRASFPGRSALVPYLEVGVAAVGAEYTVQGEEVELEGTGISLGGGLNYFFTRRVALDLGFRFTAGEFGTAKIANREVETGDGVGFNTTRLNLGLAFYP
jgi:opacity protein-like surface antigen